MFRIFFLLSFVFGINSYALATFSEPDQDGDGIINQLDLDDDNDGILDTHEGLVDLDDNGVADVHSVDTDADGIPDGYDLDSDNDGIFDNLEARSDRDSVNALDQDGNGVIDIGISVGHNGVADIIETHPDTAVLIEPLPDTDHDGTPDFRDLDSDNDDIFDVVEAGASDNDRNGYLDGFADSDGNGVSDNIQSVSLPIYDTDGDGQLDFRDTDSDNDGIADSIEGGSDPSHPIDSDNDGAADYRELDSDADGLSDTEEAGTDLSSPADENGNGIADFREPSQTIDLSNGPDRDGDGIANQYDLDDDNDGIPDTAEGLIDADGNGIADDNSRDTDGDGTPDVNDLDSDNDGLLDNREARDDFAAVSALDQNADGAIDVSFDVGHNGLANNIETYVDSGDLTYGIVDTDQDGVPDYIDLDSDNDGIPDLIEAGGLDVDGDGRIDNFFDADTKGVDDAVQASALPVFDTDGDGVADFRDLDSDNDTLSDAIEAGSNPGSPVDTDGDGAADYREVDSNGDGILDSEQQAQDDSTGLDSDGDGVVDSIDIDDDNDGLLDIYEGSVDSDGDGNPNVTDLDSDNDGIWDSVEAADNSALLTDLDQNDDGRLDAEVGSNGFVDLLESTLDSGTSIFNVADSDQDGVPDFRDVDSDNDSILDSVESNSDTDGDGIANFRDLDSNGDGVFDITGSGAQDTNMNGRVDSLDDADGDTLPNGVDVDFTSGIDTDNDGIDDMADVSFTGGLDTDNDGIDDEYDPDSNGDGLVDQLDDQGPVVEGSNNVIETGLEGSFLGCSIGTSNNSQDPALLLLLGAAFASLLMRTRKVRNLVAMSLMSLAVAACGSTNLGSISDGDAEINRRVYVGAGGLASRVEPRSTDDEYDVLETDSAGYTLQLGYDISNRFSIEGHYSDLGEAELSQDATIAYQVGGLSAIMYGLNDQEDRARREGFSVFGRLGVGTMRNQAEGVGFKRLNDAHLLAGLGLEYGWSNGLGVRAEYVAHEADAKYAQLGLVYRFGGTDHETPPVVVPDEPAVPAAVPTPAPTVATVQADGDNDGVVDELDQCPDTSEGLPVDSSGCDTLSGAIDGVNFESGSDRLTAGAQQRLAEVAQTLNQYTEIRVAVAAHTDNQGSAESNLQLSKRRAIAVARYLVEQGVAGNRLRPQAYGESQPLTSNATASGRATNRRVELQVVQ